MRIAMAMLLCAALAGPAFPSAGYLQVLPPGASDGCVAVSTTGIVELDVVLTRASQTGATRIGFAVDNPPCANVVYIGATGTGLAGDPVSGFTVDFGGCATMVEGQIIARLSYFVTPSSQCCEVRIVPGPASVTGSPEITDCAQNVLPLEAVQVAFISDGSQDCNYSPPPRNPFPPDGATGAPVSMQLAFEAEYAHLCYEDLDVDFANWYFGTDLNPPLVASEYTGAYPVSSLSPGTTYYWKVHFYNHGYTADSPVWSFTTMNGPLAAEHKTWGAIKALYRQ